MNGRLVGKMKSVLLFSALLLMFGTGCGTQSPGSGTRNMTKEERDAKKKAEKETRAAEDKAWHEAAVQAIRERSFVLEADRIEFKRGRFVYVTPSTNFVSLDKDRAVVQLAFNTGYAGPNGIGGITVDGLASGVEVNTDKKGNVTIKMMVQGSAISASVFIRMQAGSNQATATVTPNFNSNRISFSGTLYPTSESNVFKGRTLF